jgi:hypothetical protein
MEHELEFEKVINLLNYLNVNFEQKINSKGWMPILCYAHNDKNLGNAFIDYKTGVTHCFSCSASYNLFTLSKLFVKDLTFESYLALLGFSEDYLEKKSAERQNKKEKSSIDNLKEENKYYFDFSRLKTFRFNPIDFEYTRLRGFTKEFVKTFKVRLIKSGYYKNYITIPITDKEKDIKTLEFRKVGDNIKSAKVLYPKNIIVKKTIFNRENLNLNQDLYIKEGISGIPKIWTHLSKNITSIFGVAEYKDQIDILKEFKARKIFIPDNDDASANYINYLNENLNDIFVLPTILEDTDDKYSKHILDVQPIPASKWLLEYYGLNNWKII